MKLTATILLALSILSALYGLKLQKSSVHERHYYDAQHALELLLSPQTASPEIKKAWAELRITDKRLNVDRGLGRGVAWFSTSLSALSLIALLMIKKSRAPQPS